jgi:hypothetical protein
MLPFPEKVANFAIEVCNRMIDELSPGEAAQVAAIVAAYIASNAKEETPEGRMSVVDKIESLARVLAKMEPPPKRDESLNHDAMLKDLDPFKMHS